MSPGFVTPRICRYRKDRGRVRKEMGYMEEK